MIKGIGVVGLYVHDQDEALDFYVDKLVVCVIQNTPVVRRDKLIHRPE